MKSLLIGCVLYLTTCVCLSESVSFEKDVSITLGQKAVLDKFKQRVAPMLTKDYMKTDMYLIRWLRAQNFDMDAAVNMLRNNMQWRKKQKIDTILEEDWSDVQKDFYATMDTYDREGRPIGVIDIYDWNIRRAVLQGKAPRLLRYLNYLLENVTTQVVERQQRGMNVTQWKVLSSADGFNLIEQGCPICIPVWIQFIQTFETNYPGWLDELDIVDAPAATAVLLEAIRPFLSPNTRDNIHTFGPNKSKWLSYLDERIDRSERRPQHGGTKPPAGN